MAVLLLSRGTMHITALTADVRRAHRLGLEVSTANGILMRRHYQRLNKPIVLIEAIRHEKWKLARGSILHFATRVLWVWKRRKSELYEPMRTQNS